MASLREKVEAELEQMDKALRELPGASRVNKLSVLELGGTASLLSSLYHGVENRGEVGIYRTFWALLDAADSAEIRLKPAELLPALAALPASNWPYGRVVAATENAKASQQDQVEIRRNRGIVGGMLQGAHVAIKWVPSS